MPSSRAPRCRSCPSGQPHGRLRATTRWPWWQAGHSDGLLRAGLLDHINAVGERLYNGLNALFERHRIDARAQGLGARFGIYFGEPSDNFSSAGA